MKQQYSDWISSRTDNPFNKCAEWTLEMQQDFPELQRVRGNLPVRQTSLLKGFKW